ncbi:unnamed protein product [Microthlaspi erraticum]|uniref:Uncharacterized protein n=1 Tax=Microthlaspi erraticum TaxID=1685480 RepID=A0A6D2JPH0_9BRAS|nr:unnamed protein product [Microthlaspi erraticum]
MRMICEKRSLSSIELSRAEDRAEDQPGECGFGFLVLQARRRSPRPPHSLGVDHSSPLQGGSLPKSLTEPLLSSQGKEKTTRREGGRVPRPDAPARPPDSIESKQRKLNSIELTVELTWRSPSLRIRDLSTIPAYQDFSSRWTPMDSTSTMLHQGQGSHTHFEDEEEEEEEPQARSSEPNPVEWSAPDGRLPSPDHDLVSQFFGGH